jgi:hypothetical protein
MHRVALLLCALLLPLSGLVAQERSSAVEGRVVDEITGEPVPAVRVEVRDREGRPVTATSTDAEGRFAISGLPAGTILLHLERIGYRETTSEPQRIVADETLVLTLRIRPQAVVLAPFEVGGATLRPRAGISGFRDRAALSVGGHLLTEEEIRARAPGRVTDLLQGIPGLRVVDGPGLGRTDRLVTMAWSLPGHAGGRCPIQLFLNGAPIRPHDQLRGIGGLSPVDGVRVDHLAHPSALVGVEVYTDPASIPPEFRMPEAGCGVIALWTR